MSRKVVVISGMVIIVQEEDKEPKSWEIIYSDGQLAFSHFTRERRPVSTLPNIVRGAIKMSEGNLRSVNTFAKEHGFNLLELPSDLELRNGNEVILVEVTRQIDSLPSEVIAALQEEYALRPEKFSAELAKALGLSAR